MFSFFLFVFFPNLGFVIIPFLRMVWDTFSIEWISGTGSARGSTVGPTMDEKKRSKKKKKSKAQMPCTDHSSHPDDDLTPPKPKSLYGTTLEGKAPPRTRAWVEHPTRLILLILPWSTCSSLCSSHMAAAAIFPILTGSQTTFNYWSTMRSAGDMMPSYLTGAFRLCISAAGWTPPPPQSITSIYQISKLC